MLFLLLIAPAAAQCQGCEAACFSDCSSKYKSEIMDADALPGGGGNAGVLLQEETQKAWSAVYLQCMEKSDQCNQVNAPAVLKGRKPFQIFKKSNKSAKQQVLSSVQRRANHECMKELQTSTEATKLAAKKQKHTKKMLRHSKQLRKMSELQEDGPVFDLVKPFYVEHGAFTHGHITLSQCMDLCISVHCPCPDPEDGSHFLDRYPAISESAAVAAGVPTLDDAQELSAAGAAAAPAETTTTPTQSTTSSYSYSTSVPYSYSTSEPFYSTSPAPPAPPSGGTDCSACCAEQTPEACNDDYDFFMGCMMTGQCG